MKINKAGTAQISATEGELELINAFAKTRLTEDKVYTFSLLLCDNEVDRDFERFSESALSELADLFVGTSGILDHDWKSGNQVARIYRTEIVRDEYRKNSLGLPYVYLKAFAYVLKTDSNRDLITDIEGGIKKETSVGCSVAGSVCSVCGEPSDSCKHIRGETYEGKLCYAELQGAVDAYEWSFVAVPAQRSAGVLKRFGRQHGSLKAFVESDEGRKFSAEFAEISADAEAGKLYVSGLRSEVLRLALLRDRQLHSAISNAVGSMSAAELSELRKSLETQLSDRFPTQLPGRNETTGFDDQAYII